jgi:hypothetical protein
MSAAWTKDGIPEVQNPPQPLEIEGVSPADDKTPKERATAGELLRQLVLLLANLTVITSLLVYFGWKRVEVQADALGIDENIFDMTTMAYVLRSVDQILFLLAVVAILGLSGQWLDRRLANLAHRPWAAVLPWTAIGVGVLALIPGILFYLLRFQITLAWVFVVTPALTCLGILLLVYSGRLWARRRHTRQAINDVTRIFVFLLIAAALFLTTTNLAIVFGRSLADDYSSYVKVPVTIVSDRPLPLDGTPATQIDGKYVYGHLLLFDRLADKVYLVKDTWRPRQGKVMVINEGPELQFNYG